jgi:autotransporter-associated beta strand protein
MTLGAGTLLLGHNNAVGGATLTFTGGALRAVGGPRTLANAVTLTGAATVDGSDPLTLSGVISGAGPLTKNGSGTLVIGGATSNTNAGVITMNAGTLVLSKTSFAAAVGAATIVVGDDSAADALVLGGSNQLAIGAALDVRSSGVVYGNSLFNVVSGLTMTGGRIEQPNLRVTGNVLVNGSTSGAQVTGGTLDFAAAVRTFAVADGAAALDLDVSSLIRVNGGIVKTGAGAMRLGGPNQHALGTTVSGGTLILAHPSAAGAGSLVVNAGGHVVAESAMPAALRIVGDLSVGAPGALDVTDNEMVIDYTGASPVSAVRSMLQSGAIVTSSGIGGGLGIGYAEASDLFAAFPASFAGQSVDDTSLLFRVTRFGDANLDGVVGLPDFNRLAANFGTGDAWFEGDFNYDGAVTLQDFNLLAANFGLGAAGPTVTPHDWSALASAVPEPTLIVPVFAPLLARSRARRRKRNRA